MMPVIAWNAIHATTHPARGDERAARRARVDGIAADDARCRELLDRSTAVATALSPYIGYAATAEIAKESVQDRPADPRPRARARPARPRAARRDPVAGGDDHAGGRRADEDRRCEATVVRRAGAGGASRRCAALLRPRAQRSSGTAGCSRPRISGCSRVRIATSGRSPSRSWTRSGSPTARRSPTSAPAAAGSRCGWRAASARTAMRLRRGRPAADARGDRAPGRARRTCTTSLPSTGRRPTRSCPPTPWTRC